MATVYMIRHAEKLDDDSTGLSKRGKQRSQAIVKVFGKRSNYHIGYILAQQPKPNGKRRRPLDTVAPLAEKLGLGVDVSCDRDDVKTVVNLIKQYKGHGNILICWEHRMLREIAAQLGVRELVDYPSDRFDLIWTIPSPYDKITDISSQKTELD